MLLFLFVFTCLLLLCTLCVYINSIKRHKWRLKTLIVCRTRITKASCSTPCRWWTPCSSSTTWPSSCWSSGSFSRASLCASRAPQTVRWGTTTWDSSGEKHGVTYFQAFSSWSFKLHPHVHSKISYKHGIFSHLCYQELPLTVTDISLLLKQSKRLCRGGHIASGVMLK